jgi:hypothetical protein
MSKLFGRDRAMGLAGSLIVVVSLFLAEAPRVARSASAGEATAYKWNIAEKGSPLLDLNRDRLQPGFAQSLTYPVQGACST